MDILNNKLFVFGNEYELDWLNSDTSKILFEEAYINTNIFGEQPVESIIEILNKVSNAWSNKQYHLRIKAEYYLNNKCFPCSEMLNQIFDYISKICSKDYLLEKIKLELGSIDFLNTIKKLDDSLDNNVIFAKSSLIAKPKGVILHINYNNLFFEAIESFIWGIITKNINIVRVGKDNFSLVKLFLQSIIEFDNSGIIYPNQSILFWKEDDQILNEIIYNGVDSIVYNGDNLYFPIFKSMLNNKISLIDNSYKYSFAVIEGKYIKPSLDNDLFNNLSKDICRWNQKTSFSPHVIYVVDKDLRSSHLLIESLFDEMIQVCDSFPIGNLSFEEKIKVRKLREIAKFKQIKGEGRLACLDDFSFTLILEYNPDFKISCLNRTVYIKRVLNLDILFENLLPFSGQFQTVGICVSNELKQYLLKDFINLGIKRITNIGNMSEINPGTPINGFFILRELVDWITID